MAQIFFRYGTMNSGKSIDVLKVAYNYREQGKKVLLLTSALDTRDGVGSVSSRVGISSPAYPIDEDMSGEKLVEIIDMCDGLHCILVDEAQFLTLEQVKGLAYVADKRDIPVIAYGLKTDFQNSLFEGSHSLLIYADKIEEIKTICWYCDRAARMNLRLHNGKPVYHGEQVHIAGNEDYVPVCRKHWHNPVV